MAGSILVATRGDAVMCGRRAAFVHKASTVQLGKNGCRQRSNELGGGHIIWGPPIVQIGTGVGRNQRRLVQTERRGVVVALISIGRRAIILRSGSNIFVAGAMMDTVEGVVERLFRCALVAVRVVRKRGEF